MYYERRGQGRPVVFLHGGMHSIDTSFAHQIPAFSKTREVIAIEQMGHGRTIDVPTRKMSYEGMALDTAGLLASLGITNADFVGWSDGGQIALRLAFTNPRLVRRVVASGVGLGAPPEMARALAADDNFGHTAAAMFPEAYEACLRTAPGGQEYWSAFARRVRDMWASPAWGFTSAQLETIHQPALIIAGDRDFLPLEITAGIVRTIPHAELFIVPGCGHKTFQDRPAWVNAVVADFLDLP